MQLNITYRHLDPTESISSRIEEKVSKFLKYGLSPMDVHVIISTEKFRQNCEIVLKTSHFHAEALEYCDDLYSAIDKAVSKIESQLRRHKDKIRKHKNAQVFREKHAIAL